MIIKTKKAEAKIKELLKDIYIKYIKIYIYIKRANIRRVLHQSSSISALPEHPFLGMTQWRIW